MRPEAASERTEHGLRPVGPGWFVLGAREARRRHREGRGDSVTFTGTTDEECETYFRGLGAHLTLLGPGEPIGMAHWEADPGGVSRPLRRGAAARRGAGAAASAVGLRPPAGRDEAHDPR